MPSVIVNTTVISNFASIGHLSRLQQLFGVVHIPPAVYSEIELGLQEGYQFYNNIEQHIHPWSSDGWIKLTPFANDIELSTLQNIPRKLHAGEAACLAIAQARGWLFLTDDRAARKYAEQLGVPISGTLGCLVLLVQRDFVDIRTANSYLH